MHIDPWHMVIAMLLGYPVPAVSWPPDRTQLVIGIINRPEPRAPKPAKPAMPARDAALLELFGNEAQRISDISAAASITRGQMQRRLNKLTQRGLLMKVRPGAWRRVAAISHY